MVKQVYLEENFRLFSPKYLLLCFLSCLVIASTHSQACNSPQLFGRDYTGQIECPFTAQIVSWFRDNKPIINGTDDLYQREERLSNGNIRSKLFFSLVRMQHAGFYTCKANTSHNNTRSCKIQVIVRCPEGYISPISKRVRAKEFSSTSLHCSVLSWSHCWFGPVELTWEYGNNTLQNNTKYTIKKRDRKRECRNRLLEAEFSLEINNLTAGDEGMYFCKMTCDFEEEKQGIQLRVQRPVAQFT